HRDEQGDGRDAVRPAQLVAHERGGEEVDDARDPVPEAEEPDPDVVVHDDVLEEHPDEQAAPGEELDDRRDPEEPDHALAHGHGRRVRPISCGRRTSGEGQHTGRSVLTNRPPGMYARSMSVAPVAATPSTEKGEETRDRLLDLACAAFAEDG